MGRAAFGSSGLRRRPPSHRTLSMCDTSSPSVSGTPTAAPRAPWTTCPCASPADGPADGDDARARLYSPVEAAIIFRRTTRTLRSWARAGWLRPVRIGRAVYFTEAELLRVIRIGQVPIDDGTPMQQTPADGIPPMQQNLASESTTCNDPGKPDRC